MSDSVSAPDRPKYKVLVVDDHPAFRYGIIRLLKHIEMVEVCAEAGDSSQALQAFRTHQPDIVLMDITLPGPDGMELMKMMLSENPKVSILVVSMHDECTYALRALRAGAKGYLRKDESLAELAAALARVSENSFYLSKHFNDRLIYRALESGEDIEDHYLRMLSDRELEVFRAMGAGLGTREIAEKLGLSIKTIETHRAHIKQKLKVTESSEMLKLAKDLTEYRSLAEPANAPESVS